MKTIERCERQIIGWRRRVSGSVLSCDLWKMNMTERCWRLQKLADRLPAVNKGGNLDVLSLLSLRDANIPVELPDSQRNFARIPIFPSVCIYFLGRLAWSDSRFSPALLVELALLGKTETLVASVLSQSVDGSNPGYHRNRRARVSPPLTLSADTHRDTRHLSTQTRRKKMRLVGAVWR